MFPRRQMISILGKPSKTKLVNGWQEHGGSKSDDEDYILNIINWNAILLPTLPVN